MNVIKKLTDQHVTEMFQLASYAFNSEPSEKRKARFQTLVQQSWNYGAFSGETLTSQVIATPFEVNFHGVTYQMAGIGSVSSYPEYRGQGGISAIMTKLLAELAEQHVALSYLAPFSYPFYRKYGFEQLFERINYTIDAKDWPNVQAVEGTIKRVTLETFLPVYQNIYQKQTKNHHGAMKRAQWWLTYKLSKDENNQLAIYEDGAGQAQGYLLYHSSYEQFTIKEWAVQTNSALQAFVRFIGSHQGATKKFYYETGFTGATNSYLLPEPHVNIQIQPYMMGRIVDLSAFLKHYPFKKGIEETYYLRIEDPYGPWNEGIWKLMIGTEKTQSICKVEELPANISANQIIDSNIQHVTQALMGYCSLKELHFYGKVNGAETTLASLAARLVTEKPTLEDYF